MSKLARLRKNLLSPTSAILAIISAVLLIFAFPDFEYWFFAWFALVPLFFAVEREKDSGFKAFLVGWVFGLVFFFGTCWWLTFAPITYAAMPAPLVYFFMFCAAGAVGVLPGIFGALFSVVLRRFGNYGVLSAPFLWTFTEFLRMWLTGNNWNAIGYSQAFNHLLLPFGSYGGVLLVGFICAAINTCYAVPAIWRTKNSALFAIIPQVILLAAVSLSYYQPVSNVQADTTAVVVAVQPNVPMNGLTIEKYQQLLTRHIELAESALKQLTTEHRAPTTVIFPESPMIFQYGRDEELQQFLRDFAVRNNASVLFNSAEVNAEKRILNSAVMIDARGEKNAQYDKIHLLPFGEYIPFPEPLASRMPAFVGNFQFGDEYDLLPFGEATGGVMICFESHFGELSSEYARRGCFNRNDERRLPRQHAGFAAASRQQRLSRRRNEPTASACDERRRDGVHQRTRRDTGRGGCLHRSDARLDDFEIRRQTDHVCKIRRMVRVGMHDFEFSYNYLKFYFNAKTRGR